MLKGRLQQWTRGVMRQASGSAQDQSCAGAAGALVYSGTLEQPKGNLWKHHEVHREAGPMGP